MTILAIYSAFSTLAALYCGAMAVKRWRERDEAKREAAYFLKYQREFAADAIGLEDELEHAVEWLNAANDRVVKLEEGIVEEAKQTILKMRPDVKQVAFVRHRGRVKPRPYVGEIEECNEWEEQS